MSQPQVVIGIDGSPAARYAVYWTAAECDRRGAQLVVTHAGDAEAGTLPRHAAATDYGRSLLAEAEAEVYENGADCAISTVITTENPVALLTRLSGQADLLVVGSHDLNRLAGAPLGSVAFRVAGHARCPVVVVPPGWDEQANLARAVVGIAASMAGRPGSHPVLAAFGSVHLAVLRQADCPVALVPVDQ